MESLPAEVVTTLQGRFVVDTYEDFVTSQELMDEISSFDFKDAAALTDLADKCIKEQGKDGGYGNIAHLALTALMNKGRAGEHVRIIISRMGMSTRESDLLFAVIFSPSMAARYALGDAAKDYIVNHQARLVIEGVYDVQIVYIMLYMNDIELHPELWYQLFHKLVHTGECGKVRELVGRGFNARADGPQYYMIVRQPIPVCVEMVRTLNDLVDPSSVFLFSRLGEGMQPLLDEIVNGKGQTSQAKTVTIGYMFGPKSDGDIITMCTNALKRLQKPTIIITMCTNALQKPTIIIDAPAFVPKSRQKGVPTSQ